jgi:hypothetical protein
MPQATLRRHDTLQVDDNDDDNVVRNRRVFWRGKKARTRARASEPGFAQQ